MAANAVGGPGSAPLVVTRQVVGGAALEEMRLDERPAVFTVAGHAVEPRPAPVPGAADVVDCTPEVEADLVARVVSTDEPEPDLSGGLRSARVVVGAGRGAGGADGFGDLLELTELLGGALGVSRVVTSLGWRPHHEQVGQTGSRIAPSSTSLRDQRRHPALGGLCIGQEHPRHQHRRRCADGHQGDVRRDRRPARGGPRDQRRDPSPRRRVTRSWGCDVTLPLRMTR